MQFREVVMMFRVCHNPCFCIQSVKYFILQRMSGYDAPNNMEPSAAFTIYQNKGEFRDQRCDLTTDVAIKITI